MSFLQWENQIGVGDQGHDSAYSSGILSCHQLVTQTTKNHCFFSLLGGSADEFHDDFKIKILRERF